MDVETGFLKADVTMEIYIKPPEGLPLPLTAKSGIKNERFPT